MNTESNIERYREIACRINHAFEFVRSLLKEQELEEFLDYIERVDTVLPVIKPELSYDSCNCLGAMFSR